MRTIEEEFAAVLQTDSPARFAQAGAMWKEAPLNFYYPNNELGIDQAIIAVTRTQLTAGSNLPAHVWDNLRLMINGATRAKEAIPVIGSALGSAIEDASA
jgi:hypothetical protein